MQPVTTQSPIPQSAPRRAGVVNVHGIASLIETVGFLVAVILYATGSHNDAILSALISALCHGYNH